MHVVENAREKTLAHPMVETLKAMSSLLKKRLNSDKDGRVNPHMVSSVNYAITGLMADLRWAFESTTRWNTGGTGQIEKVTAAAFYLAGVYIRLVLDDDVAKTRVKNLRSALGKGSDFRDIDYMFLSGMTADRDHQLKIFTTLGKWDHTLSYHYDTENFEGSVIVESLKDLGVPGF